MLKNIYYFMAKTSRDASSQMIPLGLIGLFGFPAYFVIWHYIFPQPYESLTLRLIGSLICLGIVLKDKWPAFLRPLLPFYWYCVLIYGISFFFPYMLLKNDLNIVWIMSDMAGLFILIVLLDWINIIAITLIGALLAYLAYWYQAPQGLLFPHQSGGYLFIFLFVLVVGVVFAKKREEAEKRKLEGMASISSIIAHEVRTPLLGIRGGAVGLERYVPVLFQVYEMAEASGLKVPEIRKVHREAIVPMLKRIQAEVDSTNTVIDMLLANVNKEVDNRAYSYFSMKDCLLTALARYPFTSNTEPSLIHYDESQDFTFYGSDILMVHVLFNLIKNGLYFVAKAGKGDITISFNQENGFNVLHFKDTGSGIDSKEMPFIFERFYTTTGVGTGIGLAFCKNVTESFNGKIRCQSVRGEFTEFAIYLPIVKEGNKS